MMLVPHGYGGFPSFQFSSPNQITNRNYYDRGSRQSTYFFPHYPTQPFYQPPSYQDRQSGFSSQIQSFLSGIDNRYREERYMRQLNKLEKLQSKVQAYNPSMPMYSGPFEPYNYSPGSVYEYEKETQYVPMPIFMNPHPRNHGYPSNIGLTTTTNLNFDMPSSMNLPPKIRVIFIPTGQSFLQQPCTGPLSMPPFLYNRISQPLCSFPLPPPLPQLGSLPLTPAVQQMVVERYSNPVAVLPFNSNWPTPQMMMTSYPQIPLCQQQQQPMAPISGFQPLSMGQQSYAAPLMPIYQSLASSAPMQNFSSCSAAPPLTAISTFPPQPLAPQSYVTAPQSYAVAPQTYAAAPQPYTAAPQPYVAVPQPYAAAPQSYAVAPQPYAAAPQSYAVAPQPYAAAPQSYAVAPQPYAAAPQSYSVAPQSYAAAPQSYAVAPQPYAAAPQSYAVAPQSYSVAPQSYAVAPQSYAVAPQSYAAAPSTMTPMNISMYSQPSFTYVNGAPSFPQTFESGYPSTCRACPPAPPPLNIPVTGHCWVQHCAACHHVPTSISNPNTRPAGGRITPLLRQPTVPQYVPDQSIQQSQNRQNSAPIMTRPWLRKTPPLPPGAVLISDEYITEKELASREGSSKRKHRRHHLRSQPKHRSSTLTSRTISTKSPTIAKVSRSVSPGKRSDDNNNSTQHKVITKSNRGLSKTSSSDSSSGLTVEYQKVTLHSSKNKEKSLPQQLAGEARNVNIHYNYQPQELPAVYLLNRYLKSSSEASTLVSDTQTSSDCSSPCIKEQTPTSSPVNEFNSTQEELKSGKDENLMRSASQVKKPKERLIIIRESVTSSPSTISTISSNSAFSIISKARDTISKTS